MVLGKTIDKHGDLNKGQDADSASLPKGYPRDVPKGYRSDHPQSQSNTHDSVNLAPPPGIDHHEEPLHGTGGRVGKPVGDANTVSGSLPTREVRGGPTTYDVITEGRLGGGEVVVGGTDAEKDSA
ncbi:hypothetical protein WJX72_009609 [[Myrmecia] bisecta]|uniref:Uncharacterized protein n=1 Tax=[Myrmecia] bisecta TaxID=41462 RepID=A0AAW1P266_9CHLO